MTREELTRRYADYGRWRWIAGAVGAMPLLGETLRKAMNKGTCRHCGAEIVSDPAFPEPRDA